MERVNLKIYQYKFSNLKDRKIFFLVKNASETCWKIPTGIVYMLLEFQKEESKGMRSQNRYLKNYLKQCFENLSDLMKDIKCIDLVGSVNIKQEYEENHLVML